MDIKLNCKLRAYSKLNNLQPIIDNRVSVIFHEDDPDIENAKDGDLLISKDATSCIVYIAVLFDGQVNWIPFITAAYQEPNQISSGESR